MMQAVTLATEYCNALQQAPETEQADFVANLVTLLPKLYLTFCEADENDMIDDAYFPDYVDEDYYMNIRHGIETLLGEHDTYLETFEEDMKYSDTPIAASIAEGLADIFQDLYNFITEVKESDGENLAGAFSSCFDNFRNYWAQTLCNVMRPLNNLRFSGELNQ
ncbi:MAG: DUF5063 domain-containing protein [Muribaculaceae bacterium]|nr:DUF5063 domain-containing protein [Muribaculaceae bacterium]